jgi:hypothetical protein
MVFGGSIGGAVDFITGGDNGGNIPPEKVKSYNETSCPSYVHMAASSTDMPEVRIWSGKGCSGSDYVLKGTSEIRDLGGFKIHSIFIPPVYRAELYSGAGFTGDKIELKGGIPRIDPKDRPAQGKFDLDATKSVKIIAQSSWHDFRISCCSKNVSAGANNVICGAYWGNHPSGMCDPVMDEYCQFNPSERVCSCYGYLNPPTTEDDELERLLKTKPSCYVKDCNIYGYQPTGIRQTRCPSIKVCKQLIDLRGDSNILKNVETTQHCEDTAVIGGSKSETENTVDESSSLGIYFIFFVFFLLLVVFAWMLSGDDNDLNDDEFEE